MKLTIAILALGLSLGTAWAQNPDVIENTRNTLQNVQKKQTIDQNAALAASGQAPSSAPAPAPAAATTSAKWSGSQAAVNSSAPAKGNPPAAKQAKGAAVSVVPVGASKTAATTGKKKSTAIAVKAEPQPTVAVEDKKNPVEPKKEEPKTYSANGRRDPFLSPVVSRTMLGSACNTGKRCLAIDQIALQGIVKSDGGMIAVVVNALNKAYFLRENDPVFNGYVVKITGDSIIFKETIEDKMGKPFEREVTKKISTPAV
jgi:Tfp pilus assembly protein PilP